MEIHSTRFGRMEFAEDDLLEFPEGLPGLPECRHWVLVADPQSEAVAWMQSATRPEVAVAVVTPRRFVPGYQLHVCRRELEPLELEDVGSACVLAILSKTDSALGLNLKAPLVIHIERRMGRQVIANGDVPVHFTLTGHPATLKKSA